MKPQTYCNRVQINARKPTERASDLVQRPLEQENCFGGSPRRSLLSRSVTGFIAIVACLFLIGTGAQARSTSRGAEGLTSRFVRLADGRMIRLACSGLGSPTVILESGFGAGLGGWSQVQTLLAARTRVCSYDRAGYGASDAAPLARDGGAVARDLDETLRRGGERGPFVVVGHSAGGLYGMLFAARRPREVLGLVLVDSSVPFQIQRTALALGASRQGLDAIRRRPEMCLAAAEAGSIEALRKGECLPREDGRARAIALNPVAWRDQLSELDLLFTKTSLQIARAKPALKNIPATILVASPTGAPAPPRDAGAVIWQELHRDLAALFLRGQSRLVKSSHLMMIDRPDVVADAALELVDAARRQR